MTEPQDAKRNPSRIERRLDGLVGRARAADLWERLWRGLLPPLIVVGAFLCVSWLGLWLVVPHWGRAAGVAVFALLFLFACFGLRAISPLSRRDALRRVDRVSGVAHRPASALADELATVGRDPTTEALWALHLRRAAAEAARLKAGMPSPRAVELDRYAVRAGIVVALFACAIVAGPQRYARVAAALDFGSEASSGPSSRIDAWIDPPPYTGKPPILLDLASVKSRDPDRPAKVAAPAGSTVIIRSSGGSPAQIEPSGPLLAPAKPEGAQKREAKNAATPAEAVAGDKETKLVLHGDARLVLRQGGALRGNFALTAIPDKPPMIELREVPKHNARGSLTLAYTLGDDYGVAKAEVEFSDPTMDGETFHGPSLVGPPKAELSVPGMTNGIGDAETTIDLSEHPWAGAKVTMTLVARDDGGNVGRSEPVQITLPQKPFANPLARALVEQRRVLVLDPGRRAVVGSTLDALMSDPEAFAMPPSAYLGLRFASDSLAHAADDKQLLEVADFLWGMALQLENGDLSDAEKALRAAEKELREAIDRKAPDEEIQKLTQNLQAAMDKFLKELAEQQRKEDQQSAQNQQGRPSRSISQKDLQALIDRLKEQARSGNREEAKKALDELQDVLENLKTAKRQKADPQARAMAEGLNQLDQAMRDQQDLRDETFKQGQDGQQGAQQQNRDGQEGQGEQSGDQQSDAGGQSMQMPGRPGAGRQPGPGQQGQRSPGQGQRGQRGRGGAPMGLGQRQQELRDRLADIQKKLKQAGEGQGALDDAGRDMREAEEALRQGEGSSGQAVDAQGRALEAMRRGAKKLADAMQQGGQPGGQSESDNEQGTGSKDGQQTSASDPLGRPRGSHSIDSASRFNPMGIPAAQRAQRVLEELRRRLGDPSRAQEEIDYLERLLHSY